MLKFNLYKYKRYLLFYLIVGGFAFILQKEIEAFLVFIGFVSTRYCYPKTYHYENENKPELIVDVCIWITIIIFLIFVPITISRNIFLLSSIIFGAVISFLAYLFQDYLDSKKELKLFKKDFTKEELEQVYRGKSEYYLNLAIDRFINKMTCQSLSEKYYCDMKTVTRITKIAVDTLK